jgi:L-Ala-D/L-Glu epimerase
MANLTLTLQKWPIRGHFTIARGTRTQAHVVQLALQDGAAIGRAEAVPYARYNETPESVAAQIESLRAHVEAGLTPQALQSLLPAGSARNALDCALWDLTAKRNGCSLWPLLGLPAPKPCLTAYTLSIDTPEAMFKAAQACQDRPLIKVKLAGDGLDEARLMAVRRALALTTLLVDANESWTLASLEANAKLCAHLKVALIEQPLAASNDDALENFKSPVPLCADEAMHTHADIPRLKTRYQFVNIKLDKTGGLSEAISACQAAKAAGLGVMIGCMVGSSLAIAPAMGLACFADYVDLDGPLLLAQDYQPSLVYEGSTLYPPLPTLWG